MYNVQQNWQIQNIDPDLLSWTNKDDDDDDDDDNDMRE